MSYLIRRSSWSSTCSSSPGPAERMVTPWAPRGGPLGGAAMFGRVLAAITVSGWSPCLIRARTPVTSRLGQTTLAEVSGPRVAPIPAR
jgi:hypothetical protein